MIVGSGDIATVLTDRDGYLFFASGVSKSQETRESEYQRELDLLDAQDKSLHIVYFSSLAVFNSDTRYIRHKRDMEVAIKEMFPHYTIVRIGNITWGTNPHTLVNYFHRQLEEGKPLVIRDEWRYIVTKDEFLYWLGLIPEWNCEINIPGKRMKVKEVVNEYVGLYTRKV